MTVEVRSGVHPEGFSSGDITGTTLKGVKRDEDTNLEFRI